MTWFAINLVLCLLTPFVVAESFWNEVSEVGGKQHEMLISAIGVAWLGHVLQIVMNSELFIV